MSWSSLCALRQTGHVERIVDSRVAHSVQMVWLQVVDTAILVSRQSTQMSQMSGDMAIWGVRSSKGR